MGCCCKPQGHQGWYWHVLHLTHWWLGGFVGISVGTGASDGDGVFVGISVSTGLVMVVACLLLYSIALPGLVSAHLSFDPSVSVPCTLQHRGGVMVLLSPLLVVGAHVTISTTTKPTVSD